MAGIFADQKSDMFVTYRVRLQFRDKIMGGIPMNPKMIEGWIRKKMGVGDDDEVMILLAQTMRDLGAELPEKPTADDLVDASHALAEMKQTNGFKVDDHGGIYIESRQVKAMIKESTNILFAGVGWGKTRKGPKSYVAERVFVDAIDPPVSKDRIYLGRAVADGVELFIGHVSGPQGAQSTLTYIQYVEGCEIEFDVMVTREADKADSKGKDSGKVLRVGERWPLIWLHAQENGLGALRSQGHGRFDVMAWELVEDAKVLPIGKSRSKKVATG